MIVTIITPTYNRVQTLPKLYNSLIAQTCKNFKWLVVDDGSKDETKELIKSYINENKINIEYVYQSNGGKHRALNNGIKKINTPLTFIVDSDDYLTNDAIEIIEKYFNKYKSNENICCLSFLKIYENGKINGDKYKKDEFIGNYITDRLNNHNTGDKAEVFFTDKLKKEPFLEIDGEKFCNEAYVWVKLALNYDTAFISKSIYIAEYREDGLTNSMYKIRLNSPIGTIETYRLFYNKKANLYLKVKSMIKYIGYSMASRYSISEQLKKAKSKSLYFLTLVPGVIFYKKIKMEVNK